MKHMILPLILFSLFSIILCSCLNVSVETPRGFAELDIEDQYAAMSPEGMIFRVRVVKNDPVQTLDFWSEALGNHLAQEGYVVLSSDSDFTSGEIKGRYSEWSVPYGSETYKYMTAILVTEGAIAIADASGLHDVYDSHRSEVVDSLEMIDFEGVEPSDVTIVSAAPPSYEPAAQRKTAPMSGCFLSDTPIVTTGGTTPIEYLWPGTEIRAFDPRTGLWSEQQVMRTIELAYHGEVVTIDTGGRNIEVTGRHSFLVESGRGLKRRRLPEELPAFESLSPINGRWVEARYLRRGDVLRSFDGSEVNIQSVHIEERNETVYHLVVNGPHTYSVGNAGTIVHNGGSADSEKAPLESEYVSREKELIGGGAVAASLPTDARNERIRVYSGACTLGIDRIEQSKRIISEKTEEAGGYVEQSTDTRIVIRVPAESFRGVFDAILKMGDVLYKAIETYDVTDQFTDPAGRLAIAIRARDRLYILLNKVEDPKDRLGILKQIRDYTETIEKLELSLQVLEQRIAMSRITIELRSKLEEFQDTDRPIPFDWIENLHPLYASTKALGGKVEISLPDDVAVFELSGSFRAEAADGTRVRLGTVENDPRGDSLFWQRALIYHLESRYKETEGIDLDTISLALFTSKDREAYYYLVGVMPIPEKGNLVIMEVYFPHKDAFERHYEDLLKAFREVTVP